MDYIIDKPIPEIDSETLSRINKATRILVSLHADTDDTRIKIAECLKKDIAYESNINKEWQGIR